MSHGDPRIILDVKVISLPTGATFSHTAGNTAMGIMEWPNAGPVGTYEWSYQVELIYCPPDRSDCASLAESFSTVKTIQFSVIARPNTAPVANAGPDQTVNPGTTVTLQGSGTDADNDPLTYSWSQTAGPSVSLSGASTPTPTFTDSLR